MRPRRYCSALCLLLLVGSWLLSPTSAHSRDVNLAWDRSTSDVGNGTYKIYWGNATSTYSNVFEAGNVTQVEISNLADNSGWYFAAAYRDYRGESGYSNEVFVLAQQQSIASATDVVVNWQQIEESPLMVTRYVNTASTTGGNGTTNATTGDNRAYASLGAAIAAMSGLTLTEPWQIICEGQAADTAAVHISGITTSADNYLLITTDSEATHGRHDGKWNTDKYRIEFSSSGAIYIYTPHVRLIGLQIYQTSGLSYMHGIIVQGNNVVIEACIVRGGGKTLEHAYGIQDDAGGATIAVTLRNTIIYDFYYGSWWYTNTTATLQNCTIGSCTYGLTSAGSASVSATNVGVYDCTTAFSGTITQTTCSSSSPTFVDADNDDFHLASSDTIWKDQGTDLSGTFTIDIDGQTRSGTWDIGADEYVAANPWNVYAQQQ